MAALSLSAGVSMAAVISPSCTLRTSSQASSCSIGKSEMFSSNMRHLVMPSTSSQAAHRISTSSPVCKVEVGDDAPFFYLKNEKGQSVSLNKFRGKNVVLYFYPADDTPGCTKQACAFRDSYVDFKKLGADVIGISTGTSESHKAFKEKYNLPFTLLSDEGSQVRKEWGVKGDLFGALPGRQTYVIDKKGKVQLIFNNQFQSEKHVEETLKFLQA